MKRRLVLMWDCLGLEAAMDLTARDRDLCWAILKGDSDPAHHRELNMWRLRAQSNPQRRYEIYVIDTEDVTVEDMREAFESSPQLMANTVRARGHCVWQEPTSNQKAVIE